MLQVRIIKIKRLMVEGCLKGRQGDVEEKRREKIGAKLAMKKKPDSF